MGIDTSTTTVLKSVEWAGTYSTHVLAIAALLAAVLMVFSGLAKKLWQWLMALVRPKWPATSTINRHGFSGPWQGPDFENGGFIWTPNRIYKNGKDVSMTVTGPMCAEKIGRETCGGRVLETGFPFAICSNPGCPNPRKVLDTNYRGLQEIAKWEAIRRAKLKRGKDRIVFPPVPES